MDFEVAWTNSAQNALRAIVEQIDADNPDAAKRFAVLVAERVSYLSRHPHSGGIYVRRRGLEIREIVCGKYRVFYRVRPRLKRIELLAVWHGARQEPKLKRR